MKWVKLAAEAEAIRIARSDCGALCVRLSGTLAHLRPSGALWLPEAGALVAGDLHLEKGSSYARTGQLLPPYDTAETLRRLALEVDALRPATLVLLGDSFHDVSALSRLAAEDARRIGALARRLDLVWITGNHDAEAPLEAGLPGRVLETLALGALVLRHEPEAGPALGEVAGHLHPCARVQGRGGRVRRRAFLTDGRRLVLPAFGAYAGGLNARDRAFAPLFDRPPLAGVLGLDAVHPIPFDALAAD